MTSASSDLFSTNLFLASLPTKEQERLRPHFEPIELPLKKILYESGYPIHHCTFLSRGMTSLTLRLEDGAQIEAGLVGREGFSGLSALMGDHKAAHTSMIQMPAAGARIRSSHLREAMERSPTVLDRVLRLSLAQNIHISQTAVCNAHHRLPKRLARWLLMAHDRADGDVLPLTQDILSIMLAVHRPSVTLAVHRLEKQGAITRARGRIKVADRKRLEAAACECYAAAESRIEELLDWRRERRKAG
jgi:CRP-like cAMP-binding protein